MFAAGVAAAAAADAAAPSAGTPAVPAARFWRPGTIAPGSNVEREEANAGGEEGAMVPPFAAGGAAARLPLRQQRMLLPIAGHRRQLLWALERHQVLVLVGATGCGKSTQLPQYLDEAGWTAGGRVVGCTQPRRVAASSVAQRVAQEMGCELGDACGYSVRFDDRTSPRTRVKFLTDGMLLRETLSDPLLSRYSVIMLDEAHERSVATDVLMGLLKKILRRRPELRVVVSSATMDAERFREFFDDAMWESPHTGVDSSAIILTVEGRQFPVDLFYAAQPVQDYLRAAVDTVMHVAQTQPPGDILVFLSGREEIERVCAMLGEEEAASGGMHMRVLPLYAGLPADRQADVFDPAPYNTRKVVVSTNVAEASVTIEGIVYVVDTGFAKLRHYDSASGTSTLTISPISQASAAQRAGRAGRTRKGVCYRLYTESYFTTRMPSRTPPEIQRSNLVSVVLQLKSLGIDQLVKFAWMDPPSLKLMLRAVEVLYSLGALDEEARLTRVIGKAMSELPLDPNLARMLLHSSGVTAEPSASAGTAIARGGDPMRAPPPPAPVICSEEILSIAAMLSVDNLFLPLPGGVAARSKAEAQRLEFSVHEGDHVSLLNIFNAFVSHRKKDPSGWAKRHYLNLRALAHAVDIRRQLRGYVQRMGLPIETCYGDSVAIRKAVTAGFFTNVVQLGADGNYRAVRATTTTTTSSTAGRRGAASAQSAQVLHLHPSSVLHALTTQSAAPKPAWLLYHEVVSSAHGKSLMRDVSVVEPAWLTELAPHFFEIRSGHEEAIKRHEAMAAAAAAATSAGSGSMAAADTDGVVGEPDKKHRRLF